MKQKVETNKKLDAISKKGQEKRAKIRETLNTLPPNTVIDRYVLQDGVVIHLRKDEYKKALKEKTIQIVESKPKETPITEEVKN
jgi:hypothetical protein